MELKLTSQEAYSHLQKILEQVRLVITLFSLHISCTSSVTRPGKLLRHKEAFSEMVLFVFSCLESCDCVFSVNSWKHEGAGRLLPLRVSVPVALCRWMQWRGLCLRPKCWRSERRKKKRRRRRRKTAILWVETRFTTAAPCWRRLTTLNSTFLLTKEMWSLPAPQMDGDSGEASSLLKTQWVAFRGMYWHKGNMVFVSVVPLVYDRLKSRFNFR